MNRSQAGKLGYEKTKDELAVHTVIRQQKAQDKHKGKCCMACNDPIPYEKRRNKFCSHSCAASYNNKIPLKKDKIKNCLICGTKLKSHAQSFCSLNCFQEHQYKTYIARWLVGDELGGDAENVSNYIRRWLFEKHNNSCQECGWNKIHPVTGKVPLEVNHRDGNASNHNPGNLDLLCPNCHSLTPNFKSLNIGSGRASRRKVI